MDFNRGESVFLSEGDIKRLTGKTYAKAQCKALDELGFYYILSGTGWPLVRKTELEEPRHRGKAPRWERITN